MKVLAFLLSGPLSSFGENSRWDPRNTAECTTKSSIIGILGCCLGIPRGDGRLQTLDEALCMGVRRERCGALLTDFQTVTGPNETILNAQGKKRCSTILTPKQYLQDAIFQVFLSGPEAIIEECAEAMRHPKWVLCLGRRGLVPSRPVIPHVIEVENLEEALLTWQDPILKMDQAYCAQTRRMRCELEKRGLTEDRQSMTLIRRNDAVRHAEINQYAEREVCVFTVERSGAECT